MPAATTTRPRRRRQAHQTVGILGYGRLLTWPGFRYRVLTGGRGSGRSWTVARTLLLMAGERPLRILCAREIQRSIADSVHRLLADQIERLGLPGYEVLESTIRHANGSEIIYRGLRYHAHEIKSLEGVDLCWVEEAEAVSDTSWDILIPTIRKPGSEIWITSNPTTPTAPTWRRWVLQPPPGTLHLHVTLDDNPLASAELHAAREHAYATDPVRARWIWEGVPWTGPSEASVYAGKITVEPFEPGGDWQGPYHGADWGYARDPTVLLRVWVAQDRLWIEHESYHVGLDLDLLPATWERDVPGCQRHVIRADPSRPETIAWLRARGWRVEPAPTWRGAVEDGIAAIRSYRGIVIHPRCRHAARELPAYRYQVDPHTGDVLPRIADGDDHVADAMRYALAPRIRQRQLEPRIRWI